MCGVSNKICSAWDSKVLLRGLIFMFLLSWDFYKCTPALSLASVCLRDGISNYLLMLFLWSQTCFVSSKLDCLTPDGRSVTRQNFVRTPLLSLLSLALAMFLSSLSVLHQAMKSVPDFFEIGGYWPMLLNLCIGNIQALLGGVVLPRLCDMLPGNRLFMFVTA